MAITGAATASVKAGTSAFERVDLLQRGDHYMMERGYAHEYPAYRVRFNDPHATAARLDQSQLDTALMRVSTASGRVR
jgi:hypothetical protein